MFGLLGMSGFGWTSLDTELACGPFSTTRPSVSQGLIRKETNCLTPPIMSQSGPSLTELLSLALAHGLARADRVHSGCIVSALRHSPSNRETHDTKCYNIATRNMLDAAAFASVTVLPATRPLRSFTPFCARLTRSWHGQLQTSQNRPAWNSRLKNIAIYRCAYRQYTPCNPAVMTR